MYFKTLILNEFLLQVKIEQLSRKFTRIMEHQASLTTLKIIFSMSL